MTKLNGLLSKTLKKNLIVTLINIFGIFFGKTI